MKKILSPLIILLSTLQASIAMEEEKPQNTAALPSKLIFVDGTEIIKESNGRITIKHDGEELTCDDNDLKNAVFEYKEKTEVVIEYSGKATDENSLRSWAKASFGPKASSLKHHHKLGTEDYWIISENAQAMVVVDGVEHKLGRGDHLRILPNQWHQVFNLSETTPFSLIVKCAPAWVAEDFHVWQ